MQVFDLIAVKAVYYYLGTTLELQEVWYKCCCMWNFWFALVGKFKLVDCW